MEPAADLAAIGRLMGDPHRAQILQILLSGVPQSGSSLASALGISRSLASAHLGKLTAGGLVRAERSGRNQLYSIAGTPVADAIEMLLLISPLAPVQSLRGAVRMRSLRWARMCYDHLAGVVGVAIADTLIALDVVGEPDGAWLLGPRGPAVLGELGLDVPALRRRTRPLLRACVDWTERRHHIAGSAGAAVADELFRRDWARRQEGTRIVTVTPAGRAGLASWLGLDVAALRDQPAAATRGA
ncbi:MAG TPA: helix-turn-helix transcriptional regulator [Trebonia sp.]|nr:helix-turn-helix transcriptional regulator [Trebonia sp.]